LFLQLFTDFILQMEADCPDPGHIHQGLLQLDEHMHATVLIWDSNPEMHPTPHLQARRTSKPSVAALSILERYLDNKRACTVRNLLHSLHIAALLLGAFECD
jgi:hypothetical protein